MGDAKHLTARVSYVLDQTEIRMATRGKIGVSELLAGVRLNEHQKAKVFISSRMSCDLDGEALLSIRQELKALLQAVYPFVHVELAEDWTGGAKGSPRERSIAGAQWSDLMICIFVADPGFRDKAGLYATELELATALENSWDKVLLFAHTKYFESVENQPVEFRKLIQSVMAYKDGKNVPMFDTKQQLFEAVLNGVAGHAAAAVRRYPSRTSGKSKEQVEWELQTFTERHGAIHEAFKRVAVGIKEVGRVQSMGYAASKLEHAFYDLSVGHANSATVSIPTIVSVCPDRFSFAEAARFVGYPFRTMTQGWNRQLGPLHVTCVYRTITDAQIRKHLGNPDIRVAKESWGFFARDPERSIQGLYLIKCSDETTLRIRLHDALEWLTATSLDEVVKTAQARGRILAASA